MTPEQLATNTKIVSNINSGQNWQQATAPILPQSQPPTSVANINPMGSPNVNVPSPYAGNISGATATTAGADKFIQTQLKEAEANKAEADRLAKENQKADTGILSFLSTRKNASDIRSESMAQQGFSNQNFQAGLQSIIAENNSLQNQYAEIFKNTEERKMALEENASLGPEFSSKAIASLDKKALLQLNAISMKMNANTASLQAQRGLYQDAQNYAKLAVEDATAETKQVYDSYLLFKEGNKDNIERLDSKYQKALDFSIDRAKTDYEQDVKNKTAVMDLALKYTKAGILPTDSLQDAVRKAGINSYNIDTELKLSQIRENNRSKGGSSGDRAGSSGFLNSKIESSVREDVVSLLDNVAIGATTLDKAYSKLRTLYSPKEASDTAIRSLLGMAEPLKQGAVQIGDEGLKLTDAVYTSLFGK